MPIPILFALTQKAVAHADEAGSLGLLPPGLAEETSVAELSSPTDAPSSWEAPATQPYLRDLLMLAAENRRLRRGRLQAELEQENDELHNALTRHRADEAERLRSAKLEALAEFAAGAGHEINNPLAVISGQAQYSPQTIADCGLRIAD